MPMQTSFVLEELLHEVQPRMHREIAETERKITEFNSVVAGTRPGGIDVRRLVNYRERVKANLLQVRIALECANCGVQRAKPHTVRPLIVKRNEAISDATFWRGLVCTSGKTLFGSGPRGEPTFVDYETCVSLVEKDQRLDTIQEGILTLDRGITAINSRTNVTVEFPHDDAAGR